MTKQELMSHVGEDVFIWLKDGEEIPGTLRFADNFSKEHDYRKPNYFYIGNVSFKVSHVRKLWVRK